MHTLHHPQPMRRPLLDWHPVTPSQLNTALTRAPPPAPCIDKLQAARSAQGQSKPLMIMPDHLQMLPRVVTAGHTVQAAHAAAAAVVDAHGTSQRIATRQPMLDTTTISSLSALIAAKTQAAAPLVHRARLVVLHEAARDPSQGCDGCSPIIRH